MTINENMTHLQYQMAPGVSNSTLTKFREGTPYRFKNLAQKPSGPEAILGTAIHSKYMTPSLYAMEFVRGESYDRRTKAGKMAAEEFADRHDGKIILDPEDSDTCGQVVDALSTHKLVRMLTENTKKEMSLFWHHDLSILDCKARLDMYDGNAGKAYDLKTSSKLASEREFLRSVVSRGYHRQAQLYLEGLRENGLLANSFAFIVVETKPPFEIAVYDLDKEFLMCAEAELLQLRISYRQCSINDNWPSYPLEVRTLRCPEWLKKGPNLSIVEDY